MRTEKQYMKNSESTMFGEILGKKKVFPQIQKKKKAKPGEELVLTEN